MLINIITPYGNNRFELSVDGTTELIRKAYEIAENEADTNEDKEECKPSLENDEEGIQEAVADAGSVVDKKESEKVDYAECGVENENTGSERVLRKSRNDSLFGENWRDELPRKTIDEQQRDYARNTDGYSGFLYIKCPVCGKVKGFCTKANIKEHICECGHKLKIQNLKPMYVHCDCGKDFRYYTNIEDENFKYECINCGEEVDIQINTRGTAYVTKRKDNHSGGISNYGGYFGMSTRRKYGRMF